MSIVKLNIVLHVIQLHSKLQVAIEIQMAE